MNPSMWGEEVDEFDPDRWYYLSADAASPCEITAFSGGPRVVLAVRVSGDEDRFGGIAQKICL